MRILFVLTLLSLSIASSAQKKFKRDSLSMTCLLENAVVLPKEKSAFLLLEEQPALRIKSSTDSLVKAGTTGVVSTVQREKDGTWEVVYYYQDYYIWLSGLSSVKVKKGTKVKATDIIGTLTPGAPLEILVYDFETPLNPQQHVRCITAAGATEAL